jgi:hypothetical protein
LAITKKLTIMKSRILITGCLIAASATAVIAQEYDDMYFNAKDRQVFQASAKTTQHSKKEKKTTDVRLVNPTDSYSARNVNPEYVSRQYASSVSQDEQNYFAADYQYQASTNYSGWYNTYSTWNNNPWYSMPSCLPSWGYGSGYYGYYGYSNPWGNPYYYDSYYGYPASYGYYSGGSWGYGMGAYRPVSSWGGVGVGWAYHTYNPGPVIITNPNQSDAPRSVYGKRSTRDNLPAYTQAQPRTREQDNTPRNNQPFVRTASSTTTTTQRQDDYYNRSYRTSQQSSPSRTSTYSNGSSGSSSGRSSTWSNPGNSGSNSRSWSSGSSGSSTSSPSYTPSRSSGGSSGGSSSGSGTNGRTRGGN